MADWQKIVVTNAPVVGGLAWAALWFAHMARNAKAGWRQAVVTAPKLRIEQIGAATALRSNYVTWYHGGNAKRSHFRAVFENRWGRVRQVLLSGYWPDADAARRTTQRALLAGGGWL